MSDHRRVNYERTSMMSYMERTQLTKRNPMMTAEKVLDARLLSIPGTKGGKRQINSIPQLGQHLINTQFTEEVRMETWISEGLREEDISRALAGH